MVNDRTLQMVFGMDPRSVALWGTPIRAFTLSITCLVVASLTGAYVNTVRNTIEIRQGQDFGVFYESARSAQAESDSRRRHSPFTESESPALQLSPSPVHLGRSSAGLSRVARSVKPFLLLFVPYLAVRRQWGAAVASLVPVVILFGLGIAYDGVDAYRIWIDDLVSVTWAEYYLNASALDFVERTLSTSEW